MYNKEYKQNQEMKLLKAKETTKMLQELVPRKLEEIEHYIYEG